jgi:RHH-type proline utilization regulon transcriptional repressor/proline dehydrogenase/delta 1-pyrroline-5-carboxylate dehydrogenase
MGYLVRRLLENTSNESFLRHTFFEHSEIRSLLRDPAEEATLQPEAPLAESNGAHALEESGESIAVNLDY